MVMPRYQRAGVSLMSMPAVSTVGLQETARTNQMLAQQMDRISNFAFRQAATMAEIEGREYGAINAPTTQQLEDAISAGADVTTLLPGDRSSVFGRAARGTALDAVTTQFELEASKTITDLQTAFENEEISLDQFQTELQSMVATQTEVMRRVSPLAATKFSASVGVTSNAAFLAAAKEQAKRDRIDYEISVRSGIDTILRNAETIVKAGPTVQDDGSVLTVDQKINVLRDQVAAAAQELNDVELYQTKIKELDTAVSEAKIGVVLSDALTEPGKALQVLQTNGQFEDEEVQAVYATLSEEERRTLFSQLQSGLSTQFSLESQADAKRNRERAEASGRVQAEFTAALLSNDRDAAREALARLENIDPSAWSSKSEVLATTPGIDNLEVVRGLEQLALNNQLTQAAVDEAFTSGSVSMATYKSLMSDLDQQYNQNYTKALEWLKSARGVPEGNVLNFTPIQRQANAEVAQIKSALLEAINENPALDSFAFVKAEVARIIAEGAGAADVALRQQAQRVADELRAVMPGASAQELLDRLQSDPNFYPNPQKRQNAIENLLPVLIEIEANNG